MKSALLTGSAGFVGRHMRRELSRRGYRIVELDVANAPHQDVRDWCRRSHALPYDLVVHLAAVVGGRQLIEGNPLAVAVDLAIDAEMFGWALRTRPGRILYFSSSAAYPVSEQGDGAYQLPESLIDLADPRQPDLTYGWAKLTGEILAGYARAAGVPVTVVRPFSGYGPGQALDYPFPSFIRRALERRDPFDVWGDGEQVRDFIHISDVVRMSLDAAELGLDQPVNLGTGIPTSFNYLAKLITNVVGYAPELRHLDAPVGVRQRVADPTLMRAVLGPPRVGLIDGILEALG